MRYFWLSFTVTILLLALAASAQTTPDAATPINQSAPAQQITTGTAALFALSDQKVLNALDLTKQLTANIASMKAQIVEYQAAEARMNATIAAYQQLYGPLP